MDQREIAHRTAEARRLLDEPLLAEALDRIERFALEELLAAEDAEEPDRTMRVMADRIRVVRGFRKYLETVILHGEEALRPPRRVA